MFSSKSSPADTIKQKLKGVNSITPFPHVVADLIEATRSVDADVATIVEIIECDPALTMKTLRMANSPIYGLANVVHSVRHAISLLGFTKIRNMGLTYAASSVMLGNGPQETFKKNLWKHSLGCATVARQIANLTNNDPDDAFLCGIFHDIGKLFLINVIPDAYLQLTDRCYGSELVEKERRALETDHQRIGMILATEWQLPELLRVVIGNHHRPEQALAHQSLCQIVSVSDSISRHFLENNVTDEAEMSYCKEAAEALGIESADIETVLSETLEYYQEAAAACT